MTSNGYIVCGRILVWIGIIMYAWIGIMTLCWALFPLSAIGWTASQWPDGTIPFVWLLATNFLLVGGCGWYLGYKEVRQSITPVDIEIRPNQVTVSGGTAVPVLFSSSRCLFRDAEGVRTLAQAIYQQSAHFANSRFTQGRSATVRVWPEALDWNIEHIKQLDSMLEGAFAAPVYEVNGKPLAIAEPGLSQVLA